MTASLDSKEAQAFRQGLRDAGCTEGRDVVIEWRSVDGDYKKVAGLAADLIQRADKLMYEAKGQRASHIYLLRAEIKDGQLVDRAIDDNEDPAFDNTPL